MRIGRWFAPTALLGLTIVLSILFRPVDETDRWSAVNDDPGAIRPIDQGERDSLQLTTNTPGGACRREGRDLEKEVENATSLSELQSLLPIHCLPPSGGLTQVLQDPSVQPVSHDGFLDAGHGLTRLPSTGVPVLQTTTTFNPHGAARQRPQTEQQTPRQSTPAPNGAALPTATQPNAPAETNAANANDSQPASNSTTPAHVDPHYDLFAQSKYPSATECAACHKQIYDEWSISGHAYAAISPMFHKFEQKINDLAQGTIGYFCMRCHAPVATAAGHRRDQPIWDGPRVFREGVTCVACHRINEQYLKVNGERRIVPGDLSQPVYGSGDGSGLKSVLANREYYRVKVDPNEPGPGQVIHRKSITFEQLNRSDFCVSCHQVAVDPGIKLEVVWDQYRASPAYRNGISCQDCHMGRVPGVAQGYATGPAAVINGRPTDSSRRHSNHTFYGPGASIAHPGVFPDNKDADRWTVNDWLMFDWRAGWGTDAFEDPLADGLIHASFPPVWSNVDDRYDAREVLEANLEKLKLKRRLREEVMANGSHVAGPYFDSEPRRGETLRIHYLVTNTNPGHNLPSGSLGAQPQLWLNVVLIGPDGQRRWESGYVDSIGDLADIHSTDVQQRKIPFDRQLFNLQTKFLTTNIKGTDREMFLPINVDIDQIPFIRPGSQPISVINHPPFIRMEAHSLPPLGRRRARYRIPAEALDLPGVYRLTVRLRSRAEPVYFLRFVNATEEMERALNASIVDTHVESFQFVVP